MKLYPTADIHVRKRPRVKGGAYARVDFGGFWVSRFLRWYPGDRLRLVLHVIRVGPVVIRRELIIRKGGTDGA